MTERVGDDGNVVPLGTDPPPTPVTPPSRPSGMHGAAIAGMALSALVAIVTGFLFIAVGWTGSSGKVVVTIGFLAAVSFLACASAAVFTAARDTYAHTSDHEDDSSAG